MYSFLHLVSTFTTLFSRSDITPRDTCSANSTSTRSEWCDYSIDTDYTSTGPDTGVTKEYWLELTDATVAPDGVSRTAMGMFMFSYEFST